MQNQIIQTSSRTTVQAILSDAIIFEGAIGTTIEKFLLKAQGQNIIKSQPLLVAAICNGRLRELNYELTVDSTISPIYLSDSDGSRIYRRSLVLLLTTAVDELWKGTQITVDYAVPDGGFYCMVKNRERFTEEELQRLEQYMRDLVKANDPITKQIVPLEEAVAIFSERGDDDKVRLLEYRTRDNLTLYTLRGRSDYYYGYMLPSTGYMQHFGLVKGQDAFILQYPRPETPNTLRSIRNYDKLAQVFQQMGDWLETMGVEDVGRLNHLIRHNHIRELILIAEALHEQNIARIATQIWKQHEEGDVRLALIAGPTSSGKTTFSKRLAIQLLAHGVRPFTLEMDNYFVDREFTPRDESGDYDFENLNALNLELFNQQLVQLINGERVQFPKFDFQTGRSSPGRWGQLQDHQVIILEGIHGLNPDLLPEISSDLIFRIFISAITQLNIDAHNRIPTTDVRLLRRMVRDARSRGYSVQATLDRWHSVRRGEKRNIFLYQENADAMFNSALPFELAAIRPLAEPLLRQIPQDSPTYIEANRLLSFLRWVHPLSAEQTAMIPDTSLLREFIGGSILEDYHPGEPVAE